MAVVITTEWMKNLISYIRLKKKTIVKFLLVGGSAVLVNLSLLYFFVEYVGLNTAIGENIANVLSMEMSIIYNFFLSRAITFGDRHKEHGMRLLYQMVKFHVAIGIIFLMRMGLFALLQWVGVYYLLNAIIGIGIAAGFNFLAYDTKIFKHRVEDV
ncbi:MAG: hypothetical protein CL876_03130 [Dehalococcoidales bacterium]|nr:hypothetical protein [Dehalococcoidales bacterium]